MLCAIIFLIYKAYIICMSSLVFCYVRQFHELQIPRACRHSQIHFQRAKQCYFNTCSNTLLNLEAAFVVCHAWAIPSPGKYRVESSAETSCYQQDHDAPHICNIFNVSEFGVFNRSTMVRSGAPQIHGLPWGEDPAHCSGLEQRWPPQGCVGWTSHSPERTQSPGNHLRGPAAAECRRLPCTQPPALLHHPARLAGGAAHSDTVFYQLLQLGPQRCSGVLGPFTPS